MERIKAFVSWVGALLENIVLLWPAILLLKVAYRGTMLLWKFMVEKRVLALEKVKALKGKFFPVRAREVELVGWDIERWDPKIDFSLPWWIEIFYPLLWIWL
ncbi:MAG: hypothetical protein Q8P93_00255, partial [bacterium]|nr:hypothetical protein [bacterium]